MTIRFSINGVTYEASSSEQAMKLFREVIRKKEQDQPQVTHFVNGNGVELENNSPTDTEESW